MPVQASPRASRRCSFKLDARGASEMLNTTRENLGRPMAVVFIESKRVAESEACDGVRSGSECTEEEVISVATIQGVFSSNFQITGLLAGEARELALLLRAGSLAARSTSSSSGRSARASARTTSTAASGRCSSAWSHVHLHGCLLPQVRPRGQRRAVLEHGAADGHDVVAAGIPVVAGIAGIVLTVGMAADANILIYERIREEVRNGMSPHAAINAGFDKAFSAIADSNVTTLIAGIVLFTFGTGPVRGVRGHPVHRHPDIAVHGILGSRALIT